jgi:putative chitobiose transport system substrate-binding protein
MAMVLKGCWKWLGWALGGLLLSWLMSCQTAPTPAPTGGIEFWTMQLQPKFTPYFTQLLTNFQQEPEGTDVKWVDIPWEAMESKILTAVSANTAPDVVNLNPKFAAQLAAKNAWLNLDEQVSAEVKARYLPNIWQANSLEGKTFGFPWYLTTKVTVYNQDLLKQAGLTAPPATFAELAQAAKTIKGKTGKYGFFVTLAPNDSGEVMESLVQMGVQLLDDQGKAAFNSAAGKAAFQYWVDLYQQGLLPPEILTQGHRHAVELYQSGAMALLSTGPEFLTSIETNAPQIAKVSAAAPQITGPNGKTNVAVMNLVIPRATKNPQAALNFAQFVTNVDNQLAFAQAANVLPSAQAAVEAYIKQLEQGEKNTALQQARLVSAQQLPSAEVLIPPRKNIGLLQKALYENLAAAMLKQKTVEQALADAAQVWDSQA